MDSKKRRLQMLPEVLPTPTRVQPNTSVRSRALTRLGILAALGAAGVANACGGTSSNGSNGDAGLPNDGGPPDGDPYGVVDPLPSPACFKDAAALSAEARYIRPTDGGADAGENDAGDAGDAGAEADAGDVEFSGPDRDVEATLSWAQSGVVISGASNAFWSDDADVTVVGATSTTQGATVLLHIGRYEEGRVIVVHTNASCSGGYSNIKLTLTLHGDRVDATLEDMRY